MSPGAAGAAPRKPSLPDRTVRERTPDAGDSAGATLARQWARDVEHQNVTNEILGLGSDVENLNTIQDLGSWSASGGCQCGARSGAWLSCGVREVPLRAVGLSRERASRARAQRRPHTTAATRARMQRRWHCAVHARAHAPTIRPVRSPTIARARAGAFARARAWPCVRLCGFP